jgi:hypothetical protein
LSANVSYTEPVGKKGMLQFSYQPSYSKNKSDQRTYNFDSVDNKYSAFIPENSNIFENTTTTQNGGVTYRLGASRDNQFSAGVNIQNSRLESDRSYPGVYHIDQTFTDILPNLMWRKKISPRSTFNIFYRASTNFPSVTQLQDVINKTNLLNQSVGNPDLKESYNHFLTGRYTFTNTQKGQSFFANLFLNTQQNYISNATYIPQKGDSVIAPLDTLAKGAVLTKPVNLNGYKSLRTFFTFSQPIKFIKSNLNLSTGFSYTTTPAMFNNAVSMTKNASYNLGVVVASNISQYVDFNLSYSVAFSNIKSTDPNQLAGASNYVDQAIGLQMNLLTKNGWFVQNDISNQNKSGYSQGANINYWLWNGAVGKKFLKNQVGELKVSVFDLLKQNQSVTRTIDPNYLVDTRSKVLQQYFMLTFTYSLRNFGKPATNNFQRRDRGPMF